MSIAALFTIAKTWKLLKSPTTDLWLKMSHTHTHTHTQWNVACMPAQLYPTLCNPMECSNKVISYIRGFQPWTTH